MFFREYIDKQQRFSGDIDGGETRDLLIISVN